jgi:GT2 family glycosyltransferase
MACHNRRELTLACLRSLYGQQRTNYELSVFLVDDGSSDGTAGAVMSEFPDVEVLSGSGHLYWGGAMRLAFQAAERRDADFHLWLNDDVILHSEAVALLLSTYEEVRQYRSTPILVVGAVQDPATRRTTYSGLEHRAGWHPLRFDHVEPGPGSKRCETMSGNVALVSRDAFKLLGAVDEAFVHTMGDCDYGLRLGRSGGEVWLASRHVGTCPRGDRPVTGGSVAQRLRGILSPKKVPPVPWLVYVRRHGGPVWPILWIGPYAHVVAGSVRDAVSSGARRVRLGHRSPGRP